MKSFLRILSFARPLGVYVPQYIVYSLLYTIFLVVNTALLIPVLNVLFGQVDVEEIKQFNAEDFEFSVDYFVGLFNRHLVQTIESSGYLQALMYVCIIIIVTALLSNIFRYLSSLILSRLRINAVRNMRNSLYHKLSELHLGFFTEERKGDLLSRSSNDILQLENTIVEGFKVLFIEPFMVIAYITFLMILSAKLTLYVIILIVTSVFIIAEIIRRLKRNAREGQESMAKINSIMEETLSGIRLIKAFLARTFMINKFESETNTYARVSMSLARKNDLAGPMSEFLGIVIVTVLVMVGGYQIFTESNEIEAAQFMVFIIVFARLIQPLKGMNTAISSIQRGLASGERVFEILDLKPAIQDAPNASELQGFSKRIAFENVNFSYGNVRVLRELSFTIEKGSTVALVGPSGGGKSTIADLLARFYDPENGQITIDDTPIKDVTISSLRSRMGIITQDSILFNDTIFNNIAFGKVDASMEEVKEAARIAHAAGFIEAAPEGYDTVIGEGGGKLSGGQRQRISIARAILKNPDILIMDEATSALDSESERLVQDAIENLMKGRTSLVIAHRLSTIKHADKILVIEKGRILEKGTHKSLLKNGGLYSKLSSMQTTH